MLILLQIAITHNFYNTWWMITLRRCNLGYHKPIPHGTWCTHNFTGREKYWANNIWSSLGPNFAPCMKCWPISIIRGQLERKKIDSILKIDLVNSIFLRQNKFFERISKIEFGLEIVIDRLILKILAKNWRFTLNFARLSSLAGLFASLTIIWPTRVLW